MGSGIPSGIDWLLRDASDRMNEHLHNDDIREKVNWADAQWWSFPKGFGSTAGPWGGIGGQMITSFQAVVVDFMQDDLLIYISGRFYRFLDKHNVTCFGMGYTEPKTKKGK